MASVSICPACRKAVPTEQKLRPATFPFCNERCKLIDLGKWLTGEYVLPEPISHDDDAAIQEVLTARTGEV